MARNILFPISEVDCRDRDPQEFRVKSSLLTHTCFIERWRDVHPDAFLADTECRLKKDGEFLRMVVGGTFTSLEEDLKGTTESGTSEN